MKRHIIIFSAFFAGLFFSATLKAQHVFTITQNNLSKETELQLKNQTSQKEIAPLSLTKNNDGKDVYSVTLSSINNRKIIILNESTGGNVVITPTENSKNEFQLEPFFIEELKQGALGYAPQYLVMETTNDFSVQKVSSVPVAQDEVYIPQFFYGKKGNMKEALPKDRQILYIFKEKPQYFPAFPNDPENLLYVAQLEEEMSYYVYLYKFPNGDMCIYDEHFNPGTEKTLSKSGGNLQFILSGTLSAPQQTATEYALELWGEQLAGTIPIDIQVSFIPLGTGILGQSYRMKSFYDSTTQTWYPPTLWNQLKDYDHTLGRDIKIEMNSNYSSSYYFGLDGNAGSKTDWVTVMLHEVTHGLGFFPLCKSDGKYYYTTDDAGQYQNTTNYPGIYDRQLFQGTSGVCLTDLSQSERASLLVSNNLYSGAPGSFLLAANGGTRVKIYAPSSYAGGSSNSHWDQSVTFQTFMKYAYAYPLHTFNDKKISLLKDLGWTVPVTNAIYATFKPNGGTGYMSAQQFLPDIPQKIAPNTFTKIGYSFDKWTTKQDGTGEEYQNEQIISIQEDIELYAQWNANSYTLSFDVNGGTEEIASKEVTYDQAVGELPIPTKPGYKLKAWRVDSKDISETYVWNYASNKTAIAAWEMATYKIVATATYGGKITPKGSNIVVPEGNNQKFTITPDDGYEIADVLIDDSISAGATSSYTFEDVKADHTIHAIFSIVDNVENLLANAIQIFPNPTTGAIQITSYMLQVAEIEFFDIFGRKQGHIPCIKCYETIDISYLPSGIYLVKINTNKGVVTKKLIKL